MRRHRGPALLAIAAAVMVSALAVVPASGNDRWVTVRPGDTLGEIALSEGVSLAQLVALNQIDDPDRIRIGQRLLVSVAATPSPATPGQPTAAAVHVVLAGESAWGIARRYRVDLGSLVAINRLADPALIRPGQRLIIPGTGSAATGAPAARSAEPPARQHRVAPGESLWSIARRYGVTLAALVNANRVANPSLIRVGQVLVIPAVPGASSVGSGGTMPPAMAGLVAARADVGRLIEDAAAAEGVPVALALALAWQESGWQQSVVSSADAVGVMQITGPTADWVASTMLRAPVDLSDIHSNIGAGLRLLHHYLDRYGQRDLALAAYYQGQTGTDRHGIYPSSRPYVDSILALERLFSR